MTTIYRLKQDVDLNEFAKRGYDLIPQICCLEKIIKQPDDGDAVKFLLDKYYTNSEWVEKFYKPNKKKVSETLGLRYYSNGDIRYSKKFNMILTDWRIEIEAHDEAWVGFTSLDPYDHHVYYDKNTLDKYCKQEIDELLELGLIEEYEVSANEGGHLEQ